jgi:hypothetical protein
VGGRAVGFLTSDECAQPPAWGPDLPEDLARGAREVGPQGWLRGTGGPSHLVLRRDLLILDVAGLLLLPITVSRLRCGVGLQMGWVVISFMVRVVS